MIVIGHRGARGLEAENTLNAVKKAIELGADAIEFDLRVTRDGKVVLSHDAFIEGSHLDHRIASTDYIDLKKLEPSLATFKEVLDTINNKASLYVEVKPSVKLEPIIKIIKEYLAKGWPADKFALGSFDQKTLLKLHRALPKNPIIVIETWSGMRARRRAKQLGTKIISMSQRWLWFGFIEAMTRNGYILYCYTLDNPSKAKKWAKHGLAGVVTDYPDRFKR